MSAFAWASGRALQYAAATAVVALAVSALASGPDAERFATIAYLGAIVAALALMLRWFARGALPAERVRGPLFPAILSFAFWLAIFVIAGTMVAAQPHNAMQAVAVSLGLIGAAALVRGGAIPSLHASLSRGGRLTAATRYAVVLAIGVLGAGALAGSAQPEGLAKLAYLAVLAATAAIACSLIAPTRTGASVQRLYARAGALSSTPASAAIFTRTAEYGVATAIVAMLLASLFPRPYSERFATAAYLALLFAVLGVAMRWRLTSSGVSADDAAVRTFDEPLKFTAWVVGFALLGSALAFSYIAETIAIIVCLYAMWAAIAKRARLT